MSRRRAEEQQAHRVESGDGLCAVSTAREGPRGVVREESAPGRDAPLRRRHGRPDRQQCQLCRVRQFPGRLAGLQAVVGEDRFISVNIYRCDFIWALVLVRVVLCDDEGL